MRATLQHELHAFKVGQHVETHPATNAWMRGDRFGTVDRIGRLYVVVKLDRSGRTLRFAPRNLLPVG